MVLNCLLYVFDCMNHNYSNSMLSNLSFHSSTKFNCLLISVTHSENGEKVAEPYLIWPFRFASLIPKMFCLVQYICPVRPSTFNLIFFLFFLYFFGTLMSVCRIYIYIVARN